MPAELKREPLDNVLINLVERMVYGTETHEQPIPRGGKKTKTLTLRQLLFEQTIEERDVADHMKAVRPTWDGHTLVYRDGNISADAGVDFDMMKNSKVIAKVEMKMIDAKVSAKKDFGEKALTPQMNAVASGPHSKSPVNKALQGNYGIVVERVEGGSRGTFGDVKQIALFKWHCIDEGCRPVIFCFIPVWRPSDSEGSSSSGGEGSSAAGAGDKKRPGGGQGGKPKRGKA